MAHDRAREQRAFVAGIRYVARLARLSPEQVETLIAAANLAAGEVMR